MSSEKTTELDLHKWAATDYVQRTEFNDNFAKIDEHAAGVTARLAQSTYKSLADFNITGNGLIETSKLQAAIDYANQNKVILFNNEPINIRIDAPVYSDGNLRMLCNDLTITKVNGSLGNGSNLQRNGAFVDNYNKDAILILTHANERFTFNIHLDGINFRNNNPSINAIGIFAPFVAESSFKNLTFGGVKNGIYGYCWYLIKKMHNLKLLGGEYVLKLTDDGTGIGSSTSIDASSIYSTDSLGCFDLFGLSYSTFNIPMADRPTGEPFVTRFCNSITINSPSTEYTQKGNFIRVQGGEVVVNSPRCFNPKASDQNTESAIFRVTNGGTLIVNGGIVNNYAELTGITYYANFPIYINGGKIIINGTKMPTNAQPFFLNNNADVIMNNDGNEFKKITKTDNINAFSKGIVDSGNNANGNYVKFDDGTLICTMTTTASIDIVNGTYFRSGDITITTPSTFINNNYTANVIANSDGFAIITANQLLSSSVSSLKIRAMSTATIANVVLKIKIIGRWKV